MAQTGNAAQSLNGRVWWFSAGPHSGGLAMKRTLPSRPLSTLLGISGRPVMGQADQNGNRSEEAL